jgi:hypothetical protein
MLSPLEAEFLRATRELVKRQAELLPQVAEALGVDPYRYWILDGRACSPRAGWDSSFVPLVRCGPRSPTLKTHLLAPRGHADDSRTSALCDALFAKGHVTHAAPRLVELCGRYRRRDPDGAGGIDIPKHEWSGLASDLWTCHRLVLAEVEDIAPQDLGVSVSRRGSG